MNGGGNGGGLGQDQDVGMTREKQTAVKGKVANAFGGLLGKARARATHPSASDVVSARTPER